jgi:SAM-dependent methyltransferase
LTDAAVGRDRGSIFLKISQCRLCHSDRIEKVIDLGFHPLADTFLPPDLQFGPEVHYPLQLGLCQDCGHVFTLFAVSAIDRYQKQDYSYESGNSKVSVEHFKEFADAVIKERAPAHDTFVVDIGSNDGTLLSHFQARGFENVLGVEPSKNMTAIANRAGIRTVNDFFASRAADHIRGIGKVGVLLSANVVNHADDIDGLLTTARAVLDPDGMVVFEVPYLLDLVRSTAFDTIYHEHVHYYGVKPLAAALKRNGFSVFKVENLEYMCGSIRVYSRLGGEHDMCVEQIASREVAAGLYETATYRQFMQRVQRTKLTTIAHLTEILSNGGKIIGIGAATKGNTFLNYCRIDTDLVSYITDASALKIGKLTPGSHIPIISDADIDPSATHALILPWNIAPLLQKKLAHLGLKFYVPQIQATSI